MTHLAQTLPVSYVTLCLLDRNETEKELEREEVTVDRTTGRPPTSSPGELTTQTHRGYATFTLLSFP